jgi:hypothetical protein
VEEREVGREMEPYLYSHNQHQNTVTIGEIGQDLDQAAMSATSMICQLSPAYGLRAGYVTC